MLETLTTLKLIADDESNGITVRPIGERGVEVRLCRSPGNRISLEMLDALVRVADVLVEAPEVWSVLLTADGENFCEGADLSDPELPTRLAGGAREMMVIARLGQRLIETWSCLPMPTVVAAQGNIIGAGAGLWIASDFRVCGKGAALWFPEVDRGMHLSWGIVPKLAQDLGTGWAKRLALLGEQIQVEAFSCPSVEVVADDALQSTAEDYIQRLSAKPPLAIRAIKQSCNSLVSADFAHASQDPELFAHTIGSRDFREALAAWREKRPGNYEGN